MILNLNRSYYPLLLIKQGRIEADLVNVSRMHTLDMADDLFTGTMY